MSPPVSEKALRADVVDGIVLFTFESVLEALGDPGLIPTDAPKVEPWGLKDQHVPETVKENMYGESVTSYLYDRKALEEYESMMNQPKLADSQAGGADGEGVNAGTAQSDGPEHSDQAGGSGGSVPGGPEDSGEVGGSRQDSVLLDCGPAPQVSG